MSNILSHAMKELDLIGMTEDSPDEMNRMMRKHILHMMQEFANEGHSGFSASYAISILTKLLDFKPLTPLTGEDEEWHEVSERMGSKCWQNKRASHVFKDETGAYDIDGKVFWEWAKSHNDDGSLSGEAHKSYYTCRDSRVPVTFPYVVPEKPIYEYRYSDAEPPQPPQIGRAHV